MLSCALILESPAYTADGHLNLFSLVGAGIIPWCRSVEDVKGLVDLPAPRLTPQVHPRVVLEAQA